MKYIKLFENYSDSEWDSRYSEYINWYLINDAKDLALEYIDNGFVLAYYIYVGSDNLLNGIYTHEIDSMKRFTIRETERFAYSHQYDRFFDGGIAYTFQLYKEDRTRVSASKHKKYKNELERLTKMYPDEKIKII